MEFKFKRKREEPFGVLDIGTEAVKSLILIKKDEGVNILGFSVKYFDYENIFDKGFNAEDFEMEIMKETVLKSLQEAFSSFIIISSKKKNLRDIPFLLTMNPKLLHASVVEEFSIRPKKEKRISRKERDNIYKYALKSAQDKIGEIFFRQSGILGNDIEFVSMMILAKKIEGYPVDDIERYQGKNLNFQILGSFVVKVYAKKILSMLSDLGLKVLKTVHLSQVVTDAFPDVKEGVILDMGGEVSEAFLINNGILDKIEIVGRGGGDFTERIFDSLAIDRKEARNLKERYSLGSLSSDVSSRIKDIMAVEKNVFRKDMLKYYKSRVLLFGGASLLPEIKDVFPRRNIINVNDIKKVEDLTKKAKSPQFIPAVLVSLSR